MNEKILNAKLALKAMLTDQDSRNLLRREPDSQVIYNAERALHALEQYSLVTGITVVREDVG